MRVWEYSKTTREILDYTQYYVNLSAANTADNIVWHKVCLQGCRCLGRSAVAHGTLTPQEYSAVSEYGLRSLDATALDALASTAAANATAFARIWYHYRSEYVPEKCDAKCRKAFTCKLNNGFPYAKYLECRI